MKLGVSRRREGKFQITELELGPAPAEFGNYRIVQLTDFHYGAATSRAHVEQAIAVTKELHPDLVVLTGDFLQLDRTKLHFLLTAKFGPRLARWSERKKRVRAAAAELAAICSGLRPPDGVLAVWGNHDYHEGKATIAKAFGRNVRFLVNEKFTVRRAQRSLAVTGLDDLRRGRPELGPIGQSTEDSLRLLLVHNPDYFAEADAAELSHFDLALSGHTHGGQIRLPLLGAPVTRTKQREHSRGLSRCGELPIYVSSGIGYGLIGIRLFCPPEIVLVKLTQ